jgi:hypothetical protein
MIGELDKVTFRTCQTLGAVKYACHDCNYEVFHREAVMVAHCRLKEHGIEKNGHMTIDKFIEIEAPLPPLGVIITLSFICWNTRQASFEGFLALLAEADRLRQLGCICHIVVVDNGSDDGTGKQLKETLALLPSAKHVYIEVNRANLGISIGRNQIIDWAMELHSDYLMFMDGDIEIVPLSSYVMARYLESQTKAGCIGAYSANYTADRAKAADHLYEIPESRVRKDIPVAWTQYGMFNCKMFQQGIYFDTRGPFGEPGWGFEDDDIFYQMEEKGWENRYFNGMCYLHRNIRSSFPNLISTGVDLKAMFNKRKEFLVKKWLKKGYDPAKLGIVAAQNLPVWPMP